MIKNLILPMAYALVQLAALRSNGQISEHFTDGDCTANPAWTGNISYWIVNSSLRLQSNDTIANSSYYLSTPSQLAAGTQWELYVQLAFNPSSANYVDVFVTASAANTSLATTTGYFVRVGNTTDEVSLYRKDPGGAITLLINGIDGILNSSNNTLKIKVIRDAHYQWTLLRDLSATGNNYVSEGTATDSTYTSSAYFSIFVKQSIASFFQKHFFDDIEVKPWAPGSTSPATDTLQPYDVIIDEIMADPNPPVSLPPDEYIELKNTTSHPIDLYGCQVGDSVGFSTINTHYVLQPDSFVIVTSTAAAALLVPYGAVIGLSSFPALNNEGDQLYIRSRYGKTIHAIAYSIDWYHNEIKNKGGWSLEMIDTGTPCTGAGNWTASTDPKGGTPGRKNSVTGNNNDTQPPSLLNAFATDSVTVTLLFDEPLDSLQAAIPAHYNINNGIGNAISALALPPLFNTVRLQLPAPLTAGIVYTVTANGINDCRGNTISGFNTARTGLADMPDSGDVVINEILFNPRPGGVDYAELYNRSNKIINLRDCYIAGRSATSAIISEKAISTANRLFFPQDYIVATEDPSIVQQQYSCKDPDAFVGMATLPSWPDDEGRIVLLNARGQVLDELQYSEKWHFKLINNNEGVALERIDYNKPTQNADNWHSAATSAGYGTPTYRNSQYRDTPPDDGMISLSPAVFSPDNDGVDDIATINYLFPEPGYMCNITIFDANGRPVRYLVHNGLCGQKGYFRWDGLDEKNKKLPIGVYIVYTEAFNLQGKTKRWKKTITLARRF